MRPLSRSILIVVAATALAACGSSAAPTSPGGQSQAPTSVPPSAATTPAPSVPAPSAAVTPAPASPAPTVAAASCQQTSAGDGVAVTIANFAFSPGSITAKVGQPITFSNEDTARHGAALDDGSCTTGILGTGSSGGLVFSAPGTYTFHCPVHPETMTGTITITK
jgi:plastocyanin